MAKKTNIRSIRFSDEMAELIDRQNGDTFQAKFENLITRCIWELPAKEKELARIEDRIRDKRAEFTQLMQKTQQLSSMANDIQWKMDSLNSALDRAVKQWEA